MKVRAYDGLFVAVTEDVVDHVVRKHSEVLSLLGLARKGFVELLRNVLEESNEVYADVYGSKYFLKKLNDLYLNVIVSEEIVKTAYLIVLERILKCARGYQWNRLVALSL